MDVALQRLRLGRDGRSQMLTGLRGVGKTVMLNEFEQLADGRGFFHEHVEVGEDGDLAPTAGRSLPTGPAVDGRQAPHRRAGTPSTGGAPGLQHPSSDGPELSIDVDAVYGPADSGTCATDLAGALRRARRGRRDHDTGVLITIDELHYVTLQPL